MSKIITQPRVRVLILPPPSHCRVKKVQQGTAEIHVVVITFHLFPVCHMDHQAHVVQSGSPTTLVRRMILQSYYLFHNPY